MSSSPLLRTDSLLPRLTTSRLTEHTGANGAGVTVAIFDTGVDPGASGLSITKDGKRKIVDLVDCTSSGDVLMQSAAINTDNTIQGLSGRVLRIPPSVISSNPSGKYRIGLKHAFDFFPRSLITRLKKERIEAWDRKHKAVIGEVQLSLNNLKEAASRKTKGEKDVMVDEMEARLAYLSSLEKNHVDCGPAFDCIVFQDAEMGNIWRAIVDTSECGDLEKCDVLEDFVINGSYSQFPRGTLLNFATNIYENGCRLSIVVDSGSHGTHVAGIVGANFPDAPHLNGIAPNARIVSLKIGDSRLNGMETHQGVTRAVAYCLAHSPKRPVNLDSVKGAEAGSLDAGSTLPTSQTSDLASKNDDILAATQGTISDKNSATEHKPNNGFNTVKGEEDSSSPTLERPKVVVDIVNMSYGEHTRDADRGHFVNLVNDLVRKHDVIFVSSAGNEGPALSSVSAPGGTTSSIIGVGAFCTKEMARQAYSLLDFEYDDSFSSTSLPQTKTVDQRPISSLETAVDTSPVVGTPYTWTSRGPVSTGSLGVTITAPGGAVAPIPKWNLQNKQLMNGTSMSSPSAAGAIAVILSFLKAQRIPYTSALIRRAVENTARPVQPIHLLPCSGEENTMQANRREMAFSVGCGCIDALSASSYVQQYMAPRKRLDKPREENGGGEMETEKGKIQSKIGDEVSKAESIYYDTLEHCGDSSLCLENWHMDVTVQEAGSRESITGVGSLKTKSGVYLRGETDTQKVHRIAVNVNLVGLDFNNHTTKSILSRMEVYINLSCDAGWVNVPSFVIFDGSGVRFSLIVDPTQLPSGHAFFTEVIGRVNQSAGKSDNSNISGDPVFRVPISVVKPEPLFDGTMISPIENEKFVPGLTCRRFYEAPHGATFGFLRISTGGDFVDDTDEAVQTPNSSINPSVANETHPLPSTTSSIKSITSLRSDIPNNDTNDITPSISEGPKSGLMRQFSAAIIQLIPGKHAGETGSNKSIALQPDIVREIVVPIIGGSTLELCLAQHLTSPGRCKIRKVEFTFGGLVPRPTSLHACSSELSFPRMQVSCDLKSSKSNMVNIAGFSPRACITHIQTGVSAKSTKIIRRYDRHDDVLDDNNGTYELKLEYIFEAHEDGDLSLSFPGLNKTVYEAELDGGPFINVHDVYKRFVKSTDIYPAKLHLKKGEYHASTFIRSSKVGLLESLRTTLALTVKYELSPQIHLDPFETAYSASLSTSSRSLSKGCSTMRSSDRTAVFFSSPKKSAFPKWAGAGYVASGHATIDKLNTGGSWSKRCNDMPTYPLTYTISTIESKSSKRAETPKKDDNCSTGTIIEKDEKKGNVQAEAEDEEKKDVVDNPKKAESEDSEAEVDQWMKDELKKVYIRQLQSTVDDKNEAHFIKMYKFVSDLYKDELDVVLAKVNWSDIQACRYWEQMKSDQTGQSEKQPTNDDKLKMLTEKVSQVCDAVKIALKLLDENEIAVHFGCNIDQSDQKSVKLREKMDKKRQQLIECLFHQARCLSLLYLIPAFPFPEQEFNFGGIAEVKEKEKDQTSIDKQSSKFEDAVKHLSKWVTLDGNGSIPGCSTEGLSVGSVSNEQLMVVAAVNDARKGRFGCALRTLDNFYGVNASKRVDSEWIVRFRRCLVKSLGWKHLYEQQESFYSWRFPKGEMAY